MRWSSTFGLPVQSVRCARHAKPFTGVSTPYVPGWTHTYDLEVWSILCEQDTCVALVKELEEVLVVEELTDEEVEMRQEKEQYDVGRSAAT